MHNHELRRWSPALLVAGLASSVLMFPVVAQASAPVGGPEAARIAQLEAEVAELKTIVEALVSKSAVKTPSWSKAPETSDDSSDFTFKPRGRLMYDVGFLSNPDDAIVTRNLGFQSRARRVRLGAEGNIAGGFGYQFEIDYANAAIGFGNVVLTYAPKNRPYVFTFGNHETLNGLEQMTSSRFLSFVERAAFNEAFINTRRIGLSAGLANSDNSLRLNAGLFTAHGIDGSFDNDGWIGAARASYAPRIGEDSQLHLGLSIQHREFQSNNSQGGTSASPNAPSTNQLARYRARPSVLLSDVRFIDTGSFAAKSDTIFGIEAGGIFQSLHVIAEGQYLKVDAHRPGDRIASADPLDSFPSGSATAPAGDPGFWGAFFETGYYLTGETRGYRNGLWDRTKVLRPLSKGGSGAFQLNGRVDYLDLDSGRLKRGVINDFVTGGTSTSPSAVGLGRGGKQLGLLGNLIWIPEDNLRFYFQYGRSRVTGGPFAAIVDPNSDNPIDIRNYWVDSFVTRASFDF